MNTGGGIAYWAHVGGFGFGLAVAVVMQLLRIEELGPTAATISGGPGAVPCSRPTGGGGATATISSTGTETGNTHCGIPGSSLGVQ